jgi:hypothetical protein
VSGGLGDGVGVFAADYGEVLVGVFGELGEGVSIDCEGGRMGERTILRFPPAWSWWLGDSVRMV